MSLVELGLPQGHGHICLTESTTHFADNDLGDGSVVTVSRVYDDGRSVFFPAILRWLDWNLAEFIILDLVPYAD